MWGWPGYPPTGPHGGGTCPTVYYGGRGGRDGIGDGKEGREETREKVRERERERGRRMEEGCYSHTNVPHNVNLYTPNTLLIEIQKLQKPYPDRMV